MVFLHVLVIGPGLHMKSLHLFYRIFILQYWCIIFPNILLSGVIDGRMILLHVFVIGPGLHMKTFIEIVSCNKSV